MEFKCGKSDSILTTYIFHDIGVKLQLRSLEGGLAGHLPSVPHSTPCILDNPTITRVQILESPQWCDGEGIGLVSQMSVSGVWFPSLPAFYPNDPFYVQIT